MSLQDETIFGSPGDIVCRKTVWTDVVKFFLLNYGLHAVTIITRPGMGNEKTAFTILTALLCPLSGATRAIGAMQLITRLKSRQARARRRGDTVPGLFDNNLTVAHCAGALFMLVPWRLNEHFGGPPAGYQGLVNIHGQIPFPERTFYQRLRAMIGAPLDGSITIGPDGNPGQRYGLVQVPWNFEVSPLLKEFPNGRRTEISCDHSIIKPLAAIFQICYGSFELYEARGSQIDRFGYAAYSFTVIPYIVMSFVNLVAAMCQPSYPYIYLVHYGDKPEQTDVKEGGVFVTRPFAEDSPVVSEVAPTAMQVSEGGNMNTHRHECVRESEALISGAVGCAHIMKDLDVSRPPSRPAGRRVYILAGIFAFISILVITLILAAPTYIIIYLLSNFESRQSTTAQRVWIISSLVISNASFVILLAINNLFRFLYPPATDGTAPAADTPWRGLRAATPSLKISTLTALWNIYLFLISIPALGAFVVVAQMMLEHETCVRI